MEAIARLDREHGLTVVLVSHHLRRVRSLVRSVIKGTAEDVLPPSRLAEVFGLSGAASATPSSPPPCPIQ